MGSRIKRILFMSLCAMMAGQTVSLTPADAATVPEGAKFKHAFERAPDGYQPLAGREETFSPLTGKAFTERARFGINAGNTLDATGGSALGTETSWGNAKLTREYFEALKAKGLDIVRIPVSWEPHLSETYEIDPLYLDRVQTVVEYALDAGLFVILNTHHEENWLLPRISNNDAEGASEELQALWRQIAERFKGYGERLIFNIMNEPRTYGTPTEWQGGTKEARNLITKLNLEALALIRQSGGNNAQRLVMITPIQAAAWYADHLDVPTDDPYVIVSIHAYEPYDFALNTKGTDKFPEKNNLGDLFAKIDRLFISQGIPVIIDETGAMNKNGNLADRVKWAEAYGSLAAERNIPIVLWDNGVTDIAKGESFGLIDRRTLEWVFPEIVEAFIN